MAQDPGAIREEIATTRAELAATVQALGEKADVTGRVKATASDKLERLQDKTGELRSHLRGAVPDDAKQGVASVVQKASDQRAVLAPIIAFLLGVFVGRGWRGASS